MDACARFLDLFHCMRADWGGIGILVRPLMRLAGTLTGIMIFLWVILLHIPRAFGNLHDTGEMNGVFEALAISGGAFLASRRK